MNRVRAPHEAVFEEDYWAKDDRPGIPAMRLENTAAELLYTWPLRIFPTAYVISAFKEAAKSGYEPEQIKTGESLPILARNDGLIKVVTDYKSTMPVKEIDKIYYPFVDADEEFDQVAGEILANKLYQGESASLIRIDREKERATSVMRTAAYLTGSITRTRLVGLRSELVSGDRSSDTIEVEPPWIVGKVYGPDKLTKSLIKVIRADIIEPGKKTRASAKKRSKVKTKLSPSFG